MKLTLVKPPNSPEIEVIQEISVFAPPDTCYLVPDNCDFFNWAISAYAMEKEKNEWIRRYENVLRGLNYWKDKALSK